MNLHICMLDTSLNTPTLSLLQQVNKVAMDDTPQKPFSYSREHQGKNQQNEREEGSTYVHLPI